MSNSDFTRRTLFVGASALTLAACIKPPIYSQLDADAISVKEKLFAKYPPAKQAADDSVAYLVFPKIQKAGLIVGGSLGNGALFVKKNIVGHYALQSVSWGLQAGIQDLSMILYFMTEAAMVEFRSGRGIDFGTDVEYTLPNYGAMSIGTSAQTYTKDVYAVVFNQDGIMAGASINGAKYTAI